MAPPVTLARLHEARPALEPEAYAEAVGFLTRSPDRASWVRFLDRVGLGLGVTLCLAGVVYAVAWNWAEIGYLTKLFTLQGVILGVGAAGVVLGSERLSGKLAFTAAAVLVGPTLVVYSQAYQTGADTWALFATWLVLMLPIAAAARFAPLWAVWAVVANVTLFTGWSDAGLFDDDGFLWVFVVAGIGNAAFWATWEGLARTVGDWAEGRWLPRVLAAAAFTPLALAVVIGAVVPEHGGPALVAGTLVFLGLVATLVMSVVDDPFPSVAAMGAAITSVAAVLARLGFEGGLEEATFLLVGVTIVVLACLSVAWLRLAVLLVKKGETA